MAKATSSEYNEDSIKSLDWREHIRLRPGMYIGKLGDGSAPDDGIYLLLKEVIDNCIDEFLMGAGKTIEVEVNEHSARVRDYGPVEFREKAAEVVKAKHNHDLAVEDAILNSGGEPADRNEL